jgi:outer membrane protein, heavy metal efflux system
MADSSSLTNTTPRSISGVGLALLLTGLGACAAGRPASLVTGPTVAVAVTVADRAPSSSAAEAQRQGALPTLDEVAAVRRVCARGPAAAVARSLWQRGDAAITAASVLPNPEAVLEHDRILTGQDEHETTLGLALSLGLGGQRSLLQRGAEARRAAARAEAESSLFEQALLFREVLVAASVDRARAVALQEQQQALDAISHTIRSLAKGGEVAGFDVLRHAGQSKLHQRLVVIANARAAASRHLLDAWTVEALSVAPGALDDLAGGAKLTQLATGVRSSSLHPRVRGLEATARAARIEADAARRRAVPDIDVLLGYRTVTVPAAAGAMTGHGFRVGLSLPLPFFDRGQGQAAQAEVESSVAQAAANQLRQDSDARARGAIEQLVLLEAGRSELEHAASQVEELQAKALALYAAGELSMTELLDAFRAVEEARLARIELAEQIALARLALMRARGTQFDAGLDQACGRRG